LGNPPFLGNRKLKGFLGSDYLHYLTYAYAPAGAIDLIGYFVRRNYYLLKENRALGTLATNTIAQGKTREGSLEIIEKAGGTIIMAVRSRPWPGVAAVDVSLTVIFKGRWRLPCSLNNKNVSYISSYFSDQLDIGGNPYLLLQNADRSFQGSVLVGKGFIISPERAQDLIENNKKNREILFPYMNGDDLNNRSDQSYSRWVINFKNFPLNWETAEKGYIGPIATDYPNCLKIIEEYVKPKREKLAKGDMSARGYAKSWWQFGRRSLNLYNTISKMNKVIVTTRVAKYCVFSIILKKDIVFSEAIVIIAFSSYFYLSVMSSVVHECFSWKYSSTMRNAGIRYSPTDAFQPFPFPSGLEPNNPHPDSPYSQRLDTLGENLDANRREIMRHINIGLTIIQSLPQEGFNQRGCHQGGKMRCR
jgi:hypothetical protein